MRFPAPLIPGTLVQRYKRFLADVRLAGGEIVTAHCTNTGSMMGCKEPGSAVYLSISGNPNRRLPYTWELVQAAGTWIGINTLHPNRLVVEAIQSGTLRELAGYTTLRSEVMTRRGTRLDLCLTSRQRCCYVEVKNVSLNLNGTAAFPDAVSERGTKHLKELIRLKKKIGRAAIVFVIQRSDCESFRPADEIDPEYGRWLRRAISAGVEVLPYRARVTPLEISLEKHLDLKL